MPLYPQPPVPPAAQPASSTLAPSAFTSTGGFPSTTVGATASSRPTTAATSFSFGGYQSVEDSGHEIGGIPTTGDEGGDEEDEDEEIGEVNDDEEEENILVQPGEVRRVPPQQAHPQDNREQEGEEEGAAGEEEGEVGTKSKKPRDPKPHKCETCGKAFPRPSALETHKTVHSGAKPYNCPVTTCNKSFAVRSNARRHLKTHGIKLKTRDRRNRGKNARSASSLNKTLNIGESHHRDTSPDNDEGPLAGGTDFEEEGESYAAATSSSVAATASASTMTTTATATQHFVGGRVPYPTGERVLARMPGVGLRRAEHRGHVNTAADEDEVLGLAGLGIEIDPALRSEIEVIQRHVEETTEDEDDDEDEERGEGAKKSVQRQSLRLGAGRKVIIETSGIVVSKRGRQQNTSGAAPTGAATTAEASASTNIRKGKGKDVGSAAKLRGKRQGVAETRRKRGVERGVEAPSEDNGGTRAREVIEESQAPVLDEAVLRNLWASTQRGFSSSTFTAAGGAGGGEGMSSVGGGGNPSSTTSVAGSSSLPPLDQAALEKLIAAPTAWENHQRQQKLKRGLAAAATGGGGDGGVGAVAGSTSQNVDGDGGASGAGSNDLDAVIPLVHSDLAPSNVVDENVRIGGSSSAPISSHGHLPFNPPSSVRISALAPPHLVASTLYFDQTQTAIGVLNGVVMPFLPRSPEEIEVVNRPLWNSTDSSSLSSSSFSPVEDTGERNSLDSMTTATAATSTSTANAITGAIATLDRPDTYQLFIEEEAGHRRPDGTWIPESMRRFKNVHRLRNSVPFDDIGLSTLQMPFPLPAVQPTRIWVPTTSTPMSTTTTTTTIPTPTTSTVTTSTTTASSSPSQPLSPHSPKDGDNRGARNDRPSFVKMEERDSFASDIGRNPYHDTCFRQRPVLPGPAPPNLKMIRHNTMIRFRPNSITV
ncbi:hypothetical protein FRC17_000040 [Serendipita sp. 399]|nr:hypothetical protein FRC17_000040 [Serendipita sp. 399]